jgi:hypothetical protein
VRFTELEAVVERHLETFLSVGRALAEIRAKRLYRLQHATFEDYCRHRWGFSGARGLDLVRSASVAEVLLAGPAAPETGDAPLPANLSSDTLRPLQRLDPPLQSAVWRLASRISEHPTHYVLASLVKIIDKAIGQGAEGAVAKTRPAPASAKKVFLAAIHRLAESRIPAYLIVVDLDEVKAKKHLTIAQQLIEKMHEFVETIRQQFPQL